MFSYFQQKHIDHTQKSVPKLTKLFSPEKKKPKAKAKRDALSDASNLRRDQWLRLRMSNPDFVKVIHEGSSPLYHPNFHKFRDEDASKNISEKKMYNYQFELSATRAMNAQTRYRQLFMEQPIYNIKQVVPPFRDRNTLKEIQPQLVFTNKTDKERIKDSLKFRHPIDLTRIQTKLLTDPKFRGTPATSKWISRQNFIAIKGNRDKSWDSIKNYDIEKSNEPYINGLHDESVLMRRREKEKEMGEEFSSVLPSDPWHSRIAKTNSLRAYQAIQGSMANHSYHQLAESEEGSGSRREEESEKHLMSKTLQKPQGMHKLDSLPELQQPNLTPRGNVSLYEHGELISSTPSENKDKDSSYGASHPSHSPSQVNPDLELNYKPPNQQLNHKLPQIPALNTKSVLKTKDILTIKNLIVMQGKMSKGLLPPSKYSGQPFQYSKNKRYMKDIEEANDTYILSQFDNYKSYQASAMGPTGHHYLEQSRKKSPIPSPNPHSIKKTAIHKFTKNVYNSNHSCKPQKKSSTQMISSLMMTKSMKEDIGSVSPKHNHMASGYLDEDLKYVELSPELQRNVSKKIIDSYWVQDKNTNLKYL